MGGEALGSAIGGALRGIVDGRNLRDQAELAAQILESAGAPNDPTGAQLAEVLRDDPETGFRFIQQLAPDTGMAQIFDVLQQRQAAAAEAQSERRRREAVAQVIASGHGGRIPVDVPGLMSPEEIAARVGVAPSDIKTASELGSPDLDKGQNVAIPGVGVRISLDGGRTVMINGQRVPVPEGSQLLTSTAQGPPSAFTGAPERPERRKSGAAARQSLGDVAQATALLRSLDRVGPGAVGVRGAFVESVGGVLQQFDDLFGGSLGRRISRFAAGGTEPEEVTAFRQQAKSFVARSVPDVTGEKSGRVTERELDIARDATRIDVLTGSFAQVRAAIEQGILLRFLRAHREALVAGIDLPGFNLATEAGVKKTSFELQRLGLGGYRIWEGMEIMEEQIRLLRTLGGVGK